MNIELLDYTIRASVSDKTEAQNVKEYGGLAYGLAESKIENIELGYLADDENWFCKPMTGNIEDYDSLTINHKAVYSVMIHPSGFDVGKLPECRDAVKRIRVLLQKDNIEDAISILKAISAKGYKAICDIERVYEYTDLQLLQLMEEIKPISPDQVTIIDNTRLMDSRPVQRVTMLLDNSLSIETKIGLRSGENNGMAQYIVNNFLETPMRGKRTVVIEGSLLGIGFIRRNLCTECMADQLNEDYGCNYDYEFLISLISNFFPCCEPRSRKYRRIPSGILFGGKESGGFGLWTLFSF